MIDETQISDEGVRFIRAETKIWHSFRASDDEGPRVGISLFGDDIGQVRSHVTTKTIKLMTGSAVVVLKQFLSVTSRITHWLDVASVGPIGVDLHRIDNKRDTECAENDSFVDVRSLVSRWLLSWSGDSIVTKEPRNRVP